MISIVIPVYKSSSSLETICSEVNALSKEVDIEFEVIFVNDSPFFMPTRRTLSKVEDIYGNVLVLTLRKNQGQHMALLVGISRAVGEYVITMDDDLQHPVSEIPKLITAIQSDENLDAVMAVPGFKNKKHSLWRNVGSYLLNKIDGYFLDKPKNLVKGPFKIFTRDVALHISQNYNASPSVNSLIILATNNIININFEHKERQYGESGYSIRKMGSLFINNLIHYSSLPLKILGFVGVTGLTFSILFIFIVIVKKVFWGINFPGYASTVTLISFFGGLQLFGLGVIGEYLVRILKEQQKPALSDLVKDEEQCNS